MIYENKAIKRARVEIDEDIRNPYQRDRDRILHSKAFRRLMHKTQVFLAPEGDHFRTRLTHTLEVMQISRTIARALFLDEDLAEAIALGHDLGHTPFGHNGEKVLNEIHPSGFKHNEQSLRVVDLLEEHNGQPGMNLTTAVRDGILNHTGKDLPFTKEGQIVKISDRIAYINHDIDDAIRGNIIKETDLPKDAVKFLGHDHRTRVNTMVMDMINHSQDKPIISMSSNIHNVTHELRRFMYKNVYYSEKVKQTEELAKIENIIRILYEYYVNDPNKLYEEANLKNKEFQVEEVAKDYIAGMTDRYAVNKFSEIFMPLGWK